MPYRSKAEREAANWMPIAEAVKHIQAVEGCTRAKAVRQLCAALFDKAVDCRWADMESKPKVPFGPSQLPFYTEPWCPDHSIWLSAKIIMRGRGAVKHDPNVPERPVELIREHMLRLWPCPAASAEHAIGANADSDKVVGLRSVSRSELREWYKSRVEDYKTRSETPSREEDWRDARAHFGERSVSREWLRDLRTELAPEEWRKPGPRPQA